MENTATLNYGTTTVDLPITNAESVTYLYANKIPVIRNVKETFLNCIENETINSPGLSKLISSEDKVTIVISDMTRHWQHQDVLTDYLVEYLHDSLGVSYDNMDVVIAIGTHRKTLPEEFPILASKNVCDKVRVQNHDCDAEDLVYIGTTSFGTDVKVNPLVVGRKVIIISGTVHHVMAGFGGGRKSVVPGVAARSTINQNHMHALHPFEAHSSELVGVGAMDHNPINDDMVEAGNLLKPTFGISIVVDSETNFSGFFCGDMIKAWEASCEYQKKCYEVEIDHLADVVIASCGGSPRDLNLYQSCKTLFNAVQAMKKGGTFIMLSECPEGAGAPDFFDWCEPLNRGTLDEDLRKAFTIGGYIFYAACEHIARGRTILFSKMDPELVKNMKLECTESVDELMNKIDFSGKFVYVIPSGGAVVPILK